MANTQNNEFLHIDNEEIKRVDEYIYLRQAIMINKNYQNKDIKKRVCLAWAAFSKLSFVLKDNSQQSLKTNFFDECVITVLTYGPETWTFTK